MKTFVMMLMVAGAGMLAGCAGDSFLEQRTQSDRATYGSVALPVPPRRVETVNPDPLGPGGVLILPDRITGTWKFTVPETVTEVERRTAEYDQFLLYEGKPAPTDTPFVVITTTRDRAGTAEADTATYGISGQREYVLNGNIAKEWTGLTNTGAGFCELIVRKPGAEGFTGDVCHVMAVVKTEDQRTLARGILASILWQPQR